MKLEDLITYIESVAPPVYAAEWDNSGIQVASFQKTVTHVGVMLDPSCASIEKALSLGTDFLVAHHPLCLKARFPDKVDDYLSILTLLMRNNICLYSAHTSLDANPKGPVSWLADTFELSDVAIIEKTGDSHGFGFVGDLCAPHSYDEFCERLSMATGLSRWKASGPKPATVRKVACCPGSGSDLVVAAQKIGADIFITGDVKYHAALDTKIRMLDVGHFVLEEEMMRHFALRMQQKLDIIVSFIQSADPLVFEPIR